MTDDATIAATRAAADAVLDRARADDAFMAAFKADPAGVLEAAGIDSAAAAQFGAEAAATEAPDVSGFARCDFGTCWVTFCNFRTGDGQPLSHTCGVAVGGVRG